MEVFEKVLFNALMEVMDQVWNEQIDADINHQNAVNVSENEAY